MVEAIANIFKDFKHNELDNLVNFCNVMDNMIAQNQVEENNLENNYGRSL